MVITWERSSAQMTILRKLQKSASSLRMVDFTPGHKEFASQFLLIIQSHGTLLGKFNRLSSVCNLSGAKMNTHMVVLKNMICQEKKSINQKKIEELSLPSYQENLLSNMKNGAYLKSMQI